VGLPNVDDLWLLIDGNIVVKLRVLKTVVVSGQEVEEPLDEALNVFDEAPQQAVFLGKTVSVII